MKFVFTYCKSRRVASNFNISVLTNNLLIVAISLLIDLNNILIGQNSCTQNISVQLLLLMLVS